VRHVDAELGSETVGDERPVAGLRIAQGRLEPGRVRPRVLAAANASSLPHV
jgi:hypothetical protein